MTSFDWGVIAILALSTGFAVIRGALRELGTLAALGAGIAAAVFLAKPLQAATGVGQSFMATAAIGAALVAVGFLVGYFALHSGLKQVHLTGKGLLADRIGGGAFGFVRGLILIGLGFLAYSYYLDETRRPESVSRALTLPLADGMASLFEGLAPQALEPDASEGSTPEEADVNAAVEGYPRGDRTALAEIVTTVTTNDGPPAREESESPASDDPIADLLEESESE